MHRDVVHDVAISHRLDAVTNLQSSCHARLLSYVRAASVSRYGAEDAGLIRTDHLARAMSRGKSGDGRVGGADAMPAASVDLIHRRTPNLKRDSP